jgi:hypothetical protein
MEESQILSSNQKKLTPYEALNLMSKIQNQYRQNNNINKIRSNNSLESSTIVQKSYNNNEFSNLQLSLKKQNPIKGNIKEINDNIDLKNKDDDEFINSSSRKLENYNENEWIKNIGNNFDIYNNKFSKENNNTALNNYFKQRINSEENFLINNNGENNIGYYEEGVLNTEECFFNKINLSEIKPRSCNDNDSLKSIKSSKTNKK